LGAFVWGWVFPWMSDRTGRKSSLLFVALVSATAPLIYQVPFLIAHPWLMAAAGFFANAGHSMAPFVLVLIPTESVPSKFAATAIGLATLVGEVVGGAMAPAMAGAAANRYGLAAPLWIASAGAILVLFVALFMKETAPSKTGLQRIA